MDVVAEIVLPDACCPVLAAYYLALYDRMPADQSGRLAPLLSRLANTLSTREVEAARSRRLEAVAMAIKGEDPETTARIARANPLYSFDAPASNIARARAAADALSRMAALDRAIDLLVEAVEMRSVS